jgi:predicted transcriptional regulator
MLLVSLLALMSGCGHVSRLFSDDTDEVRHLSILGQERRFAGALESLRLGREQESRNLFERVLKDPPRSGVTDETLFRLSLLVLREEGSKGSTRAVELLKRLKKEFPQSIWTRQAAPLEEYLTDRQREVRTLKELNLSLSRDNREIRQSIERLKSLDLELEKKISR